MKNNGVAAGAAPLPKAVDLCLPWRKHTIDDEHLTDAIDFSPPNSATFRFLFDRHDELVAIVAVESTNDDAAAELAARVNLFLAAPALLAALQLAEGHLAEMLLDPKWHPIGHCPVLDRVREALALASTPTKSD